MEQISRGSLIRGVAGAATGLVVVSASGSSVGGTDATHLPEALMSPRKRCGGEDVARLLARDMIGRHRGRLHGVPRTYNWAKGPRVGEGNRPGKYRAFSVWGQIYEDAKGSPARNVRVACRDISGWILSRRTGKWRRVVGSKGVFGANFVEDFNGNASIPADLRDEPRGAVSATLGGGYNFHFFPTKDRVWIDPDDIGGVVTLYSARVIVDDPAGPDERHLARYLASAGGDYWLDLTVGPWTEVTSDDVGIGKARYLGKKWRTVTMSTIPFRKLRRNPPPVCLRGRG